MLIAIAYFVVFFVAPMTALLIGILIDHLTNRMD